MGAAAEVIEMTPGQENEILRYLKEERAANDQRSRGLAAELKGTFKTLTDQFNLHDEKDDRRHEEVKQHFAGIDARLTALEKDNEDTGKFVLTEKEMRAARRAHLRKIGWKVVEYAVLLLVGGIAMKLFGGHLPIMGP